MIEFVGRVMGFRINTITRKEDDGGGLKFVVEMPENQKPIWNQLSDKNMKYFTFRAELVPDQP